MIKIPENYQRNIIGMFGEAGANWLAKVPGIIQKYIEDFLLYDVRILEDLTFNIILFAKSNEMGPVMLKISLPENELIVRETLALEHFKGHGACNCFYSNREDGVLIIEQLFPGKTLHEVASREERIQEFSKVALKLKQVQGLENELPTYRTILDRSITSASQNQEKYAPILDCLTIADELYRTIETEDRPKHVLHADLHHSNILSSGNERKAVDPHGFIGEKVMESARFMENEIPKTGFTKESIEETIALIKKYYDENEIDLLKALYIDYVLSTCWDIEVNFDPQHIANDISNINLVYELLLDYIKKQESITKIHNPKGN